MTANAAIRPATYADIEALPEGVVGEIVYGALETHPRPAPRHAVASNLLGAELTTPFQRGRGGPGGWVFMAEPQLHLGRHVLVPDLAAWRAVRLNPLPETSYIDITPDWVGEIISPSTRRMDRGAKREAYAETNVAHLWLVDPIERLLEAFTLEGGRWTLVAAVTSGGVVAVRPFDAVSFPLDDLFPFDPPSAT